jgi:hypothetical protein
MPSALGKPLRASAKVDASASADKGAGSGG